MQFETPVVDGDEIALFVLRTGAAGQQAAAGGNQGQTQGHAFGEMPARELCFFHTMSGIGRVSVTKKHAARIFDVASFEDCLCHCKAFSITQTAVIQNLNCDGSGKSIVQARWLYNIGSFQDYHKGSCLT